MSAGNDGRFGPDRRASNRAVGEVTSTHCVRMLVRDDRVLLFAKPEDAAAHLGVDLDPVD
jgi:hypothetical protein